MVDSLEEKKKKKKKKATRPISLECGGCFESSVAHIEVCLVELDIS